MLNFIKRNIIYILCTAAVVLLLYKVLIASSSGLVQERTQEVDYLSEGWDRFANMGSDAAAVCFNMVLTSDRYSLSQKQQALYGLILTHEYYYPDAQPGKALTYIDSFLENYPDSKLVPWVLLEKGYILSRISTDKPEIRRVLQGVIDNYPDSEAIHEAVLALAHTYFTVNERQLADKGIEILKAHLEKYPESQLKRIILYRLSYRIAETNQEYAKALPYAERLGELKMCDPFRWGMQFWLVAQIYNRELDMPEKAIYWYRKLIEECKFDQRVYSCKKMIEKLQEEK